MFSLNGVKIWEAAVLKVCASKVSDWQVGPPSSLLAHAVSLKVSKPILYMPYLTLEANSHKIFKSHRTFRPSYNTFYEEININHTLLCLSQTSYILIKAFDYFRGASK